MSRDDPALRPDADASLPVVFLAPPAKGRATGWNIGHRLQALQREPWHDGWDASTTTDPQACASPITRVAQEHVRSILSGNQSPDIAFDLSINPYRGCEHGCIYCFARPTHSYLDLSPGLEFETRLVAKVNAAARLREALARPGYQPLRLNLGSVTDAYQPIEREFRVTRSLIEVLSECRHAFSIVTKSCGIERDLDLIAPMAADGLVAVYVSITTLDSHLARILEPRATAPWRRLRTIERLAEAGVPVGVSVSPVIPFINEPELERILESARDAGARAAFSIALRLPWEINPLFQQWLEQHFPDRAHRVMARIRDLRGGRDNDPRFGSRMTGSGVWAQLLQQRMHKACARLGLSRDGFALDLTRFRPPGPAAGVTDGPSAQMPLF